MKWDTPFSHCQIQLLEQSVLLDYFFTQQCYLKICIQFLLIGRFLNRIVAEMHWFRLNLYRMAVSQNLVEKQRLVQQVVGLIFQVVAPFAFWSGFQHT